MNGIFVPLASPCVYVTSEHWHTRLTLNVLHTQHLTLHLHFFQTNAFLPFKHLTAPLIGLDTFSIQATQICQSPIHANSVSALITFILHAKKAPLCNVSFHFKVISLHLPQLTYEIQSAFSFCVHFLHLALKKPSTLNKLCFSSNVIFHHFHQFATVCKTWTCVCLFPAYICYEHQINQNVLRPIHLYVFSLSTSRQCKIPSLTFNGGSTPQVINSQGTNCQCKKHSFFGSFFPS